MAEYTWPTTRAFRAASMRWGMQRNGRQAQSPLSGWTQYVELPGSRWTVSIAIPTQTADDRRQVEGFFARLHGRTHGVRMSRPGVTRPAGTIYTNGITAGTAAAFATTVPLYGCGAGRTLLAGDLFGVTTSAGVQLLQCVVDETADGSGVIQADVSTMLRGSITTGSAVTLINPTALFRLADPDLDWPREAAGICPGVTIDLVEAFA